MQKYPVRNTHRAHLGASDLALHASAAFGNVEVDGTAVVARFGAIAKLIARADGKELLIEVNMDPKVAPDVAADTIKRYNQFLADATGFSAKERAKRLRKSAGG